MANFEKLSEKLIELVVGLFVLIAVAVAVMPTLHTQFSYFVANLTGISATGASTLAGIVETIIWLLVTVAIVRGAIKYVKV